MSHQEEYEREERKLRELIAKRERLTGQILAGQRRVMAWAMLLEKPGDDVLGVELLGTALRRGRLTDAIRQILIDKSGRPLGTNELVAELHKLGFPMEKHTNPAATVNAIGNRLVEQGFAQKAERSGKKGKAWVRAPQKKIGSS